jgi:hypothetical protein
MNWLKGWWTSAMLLMIGLFPWRLLAGSDEGLKPPEELDQAVDLTKLHGVRLWFGQLYNDHRWWYAIVCTVLMAVVGVVIAFGTDLILKSLGLETEKIEHKE